MGTKTLRQAIATGEKAKCAQYTYKRRKFNLEECQISEKITLGLGLVLFKNYSKQMPNFRIFYGSSIEGVNLSSALSANIV